MDGSVVEGLSQPEVVQLLRESQGSVSLLISRQEVIEKQEEAEVRLEPTTVMMSPHDYNCEQHESARTLQLKSYK